MKLITPFHSQTDVQASIPSKPLRIFSDLVLLISMVIGGSPTIDKVLLQ